MKRFLLPFTVIILLLSLNISYSQVMNTYDSQKDVITKILNDRHEVYFKFFTSSRNVIKQLANIISIDDVKDKIINYEVLAYANEKEMDAFRNFNINFAVLTPPSLIEPVKTTDNINEITAWDVYPTYDGYISMMNAFATSYPDICRIVDIGGTVQGRRLLFAVISDSVNFRKPKPRMMYSSSMHGDETTGYVLMLRLIDTLLKGNGSVPRITALVKNVEIWINPLANPDGTYHGGNGTVNGATRYNANSIDLNRNFPDFHNGPNPTGTWQPETVAMMNTFKQYNFSLSMNFHGGAQVINYPWDCEVQHHPDNDWYIHISKTWVDTVHAVAPSYMTDLLSSDPNIPGITNGYAWYYVYGGRQDYMTFANGGREITAEISAIKLLPQAQLPTYWGYNFKSFFNYIKECIYGVRGIVTDSITNLPLKAKIRVQGREFIKDSVWASDTTFIRSDSIRGDYHRMLPTGSFTLTFSAPNYYSKTISGINVKYDSTTFLDVKLRPLATGISENNIPVNFSLFQNYPNPFNNSSKIKFQVSKLSDVKIIIYDVLGKELMTLVNGNYQPGEYETIFDGSNLGSGIYFYKIQFVDPTRRTGDFSDVKSMVLIK